VQPVTTDPMDTPAPQVPPRPLVAPGQGSLRERHRSDTGNLRILFAKGAEPEDDAKA